MDNLPTTAIGVMGLMAQTSTQIDKFSDDVIQSVKEGEASALKTQLQIKAMERAFERIIKEIKDNVLTEADKYPGTEFEFEGNKIQKCSVKTEYDFTVCNDPDWNQFKAAETQAADRRKERETTLKTLKKALNAISDDGEAIIINPPLKKETPGIKIFIK